MMLVFLSERMSDLFGSALHVPKVEASVRLARRADADQRNRAVAYGRGYIARCRQAAGLHHAAGQWVDPILHDRGVAVGDELHLREVHIDANDVESLIREAGGGHASDIPEAEYADGYSHWDCPTSLALGDTKARVFIQMSAKWSVARIQPNRERTSSAARAPSEAAYAGSRRSLRTASANSAGVSARSTCSPCSTGSPSAPIDVVTMAFSIAMASKILSRVPPPILSGTTNTRAASR